MIDATPMPGHPIAWAMVGGGQDSQIGPVHRSAAQRDHGLQLVAGAFDIDPVRGRQFGERLGLDAQRCYADYRAMFEAEARRPDGIRAVSIATPNNTHFEICRAALLAGLHVVCEKPLCFTTAEALQLLELSRASRRIVGVAYGYAGHQLMEQAREMSRRASWARSASCRCSSRTAFTARRWKPPARPRAGAWTRPMPAPAMCWATSARIRCTSRSWCCPGWR